MSNSIDGVGRNLSENVLNDLKWRVTAHALMRWAERFPWMGKLEECLDGSYPLPIIDRLFLASISKVDVHKSALEGNIAGYYYRRYRGAIFVIRDLYVITVFPVVARPAEFMAAPAPATSSGPANEETRSNSEAAPQYERISLNSILDKDDRAFLRVVKKFRGHDPQSFAYFLIPGQIVEVHYQGIAGSLQPRLRLVDGETEDGPRLRVDGNVVHKRKVTGKIVFSTEFFEII